MTPAERDAAVALAQRIADEGVQYSDVAEGSNVWTEQTATDVWPADIKRIAQALVLALAERPTCATCRYYVPDPNPTEEGYCERLKLWRAQDWLCADHGLPSNEQTHCGECGYPWGEGVHTCPSR